jgi:hypothetical protein
VPSLPASAIFGGEDVVQRDSPLASFRNDDVARSDGEKEGCEEKTSKEGDTVKMVSQAESQSTCVLDAACF